MMRGQQHEGDRREDRGEELKKFIKENRSQGS